MTKISESLARGEAYTLYHPKIFLLLQTWLAGLERFAESRDVGLLRSETAEEGLTRGLKTLGAYAAMEEALRHRKDPTSLRRHAHTWFDGFRTLKLIHFLRDSLFPNLPWQEALRGAPFLGAEARTPAGYLAHLRRRDPSG
jgi:hypothetical protein